MANRFIKSSIWTSPNLNRLDDQAELFFYRLIPLPDDYGCFDADSRVLKGILFPIKDSWTVDIISYQLITLVSGGFISLWTDGERLYGIVKNWDKHQQCRSKFKRKTPEPPQNSDMLTVEELRKSLKDGVINCYQPITVAASSSPLSSLPLPLLTPPPGILKKNLNPNHVNSPEKLVELYNKYCPSLITNTKVTEQRRKTYKTAITQNKNIKYWVNFFEIAEDSPHLRGDNGSGWRANLDWMLKPANAIKVLEGNYLKRGVGMQKPKGMTIEELEDKINR